MSAAIPAVVLGGTGYVAGELLRLHRRASAVHARGGDVRQPAGRAASPPPFRTWRSAYPDRALQVAGARSRSCCAKRRSAAVFSAAPHGVAARARSTRCSRRAEPPGARRAWSTSRRTFAYAQRRRLRGGLPARARRAGAPGAVHLRAARAPAAAAARRTSRHPGCFATAILLASVPLLASGPRHADAVRQRRHRQHRLGAQARRGHAPSAAPRRSLQLQRAGAPPRAGSRGLRAGGHPASRRSSPSCRTPGPFARGIHVTVQARAAARRSTPPSVLAALRDVLCRRAVRARQRRERRA